MVFYGVTTNTLIVFLCILAREAPSLVGNLVSLVSGGILTVLVSVLSSPRVPDQSEVWEKTRDIDNPLSPWTELYAKYV